MNMHTTRQRHVVYTGVAGFCLHGFCGTTAHLAHIYRHNTQSESNFIAQFLQNTKNTKMYK
jgi:hypothetical protein